MIWTVSPRFLFPELTYEDFEPFRSWLVPSFSTEDLKVRLSIHTFVIRTAHHTILVDTCVGDDKERGIEQWHRLDSGYLDRLAAAGVDPSEVDFVFCTHLHPDHVGWNTRLADGQWRPTFPNARYLFHKAEWDHLQASADPIDAALLQDSLDPIVDAGQATMVDSDHVIEDGVRLTPTPGHTPGHCSVRLGTGATQAVITGDMIHHPSQVAEPGWVTRFCWDKPMAVRTRTEFLKGVADCDTWVLGTHFAPPTATRVVDTGNGFAIVLP